MDKIEKEGVFDNKNSKILLDQVESIAKIGTWELDLINNEIYWSKGVYHICGYTPETFELNLKTATSVVHVDDIERATKHINDVLEKGIEYQIQKRLIHKDGTVRYVNSKANVIKNEKGENLKLIGIFQDITYETNLKAIDQLERELIDDSLKENFNLKSILNKYLKGLEKIYPNIFYAISTVKNGRIWNLSAPSLPQEYYKSLNGLQIGQKAGSCGTAAFLKQRVIVDDIEKSELWEDYRVFSSNYYFKACWSQPIFNSKKEVIATFANHFLNTKTPSEKELIFFDRVTNLLSIVIENFEKNKQLNQSNERYEFINKVSNNSIYDWDIENDIFHWSENFKTIFGHDFDNKVFKLKDWISLMHPCDVEEGKERWDDFYSDKNQNTWKNNFRFKKINGDYLHVEEIAYVIRDKKGNPKRMIGELRDKTQKVELENNRKLLFEVDNIFKSEENLSSILCDILQYLATKTNSKLAEIWIINKTKDTINLYSHFPIDADAKLFYKNSEKINKFQLGEGLPGKVWETQKMVEWENIGENLDFKRNKAAKSANLKNVVGIPLFQNNTIIGVLVFANDFTEKNIDNYSNIKLLSENYLGSEIKRKQKEEELNLLFSYAPDILCIAGANGYFTKVNPSFCKLLGYTEEEICSKPFTYFVHPDDLADTSIEYSETISNQRQAQNFINRYRTKSGKYKLISWRSSQVFGEENQAIAYGRDITEIKELKDLLEQATNLARIGAWEVNLIDNSVFWSPMTKMIHEIDPKKEVDYSKGIEYYRDDFKELIYKSFENAINKFERFDVECAIITEKGNEKWVRVIGNVEVENKQAIKVFGSFQDIDARKRNEKELALKNDYLSLITKVTNYFFNSEDLNDALKNVFELIGKTIKVDRTYYFEYHENENNEKLCSQRIEWASDNDLAEINNPMLQNMPIESFGEFFIPLLKGNSYTCVVSQLPESDLKNAFEVQSIKSVLALPIIIEKKFCGFIGFDDCTNEREWKSSEISLIQNICNTLSTSIQRNNSILKLEESFKEKETILESIGDAFFTVNNQWIVTYWNKQAEVLLSTKKSEIIGKNVWEVFSSSIKLKSYNEYLKALENKEIVHFEDYYIPLKKWFDISAYPSEKGLSVYFKDITVKKTSDEQIRLSNERFEIVTEATSEAIWDWDIVNNKVFWGKGYKALFGYEIGEDIPFEKWQKSIHPDDFDRVVNHLNDVIKDKNRTLFVSEYRFLKKDGNYAYVEDRGVAIKNKKGKTERMIGAMNDITHRKEYEESLKKLNEKLDLRAKELAISNAELEQFAFVASHDLQEPLRMVTSFLTLIQNKYNNIIDDKGKQYIHFAVDGAKRMRQIILDLLEFSKVGSNNEKLENIDCNILIEDILILNQKNISDKKAIVEFKNLPYVNSYRTPLRHIFQNLIENSLKYSKPNVNPIININFEELENEYVFSIEDNGIGISEEYFQRIFIIFQRLHNKDEYSGTGMGLSITKKIVENLGGKIWLESEIDKGTTFYFTVVKL
jgi:PAS domain S-box-containing protein